MSYQSILPTWIQLSPASGPRHDDAIALTHLAAVQVLDSMQLNEQENSCSVVSTAFSEDIKAKKAFFVVGTAVANPLESEPQEGRILILQVVERKLQLVCSKDVKGAAYQVGCQRPVSPAIAVAAYLAM
jgi:hypothetical protein